MTSSDARSEKHLVDNRLKAAALCMGIGGLDLAAEEHFGCELAWCAEWEDAPSTIIERHWPGVPNLRDLTTIDWADVEPIDVLTAGYPCQPFSHAGKRKGKNDERHLWPYIAEAVRVLRPRWVVLENVAGHLTLGFGDVLRDLAEAGFDAEWCLLRASDVGAPHQRARLFIVATDTRRERHGGGTLAGDRGGTAPSDARGQRLDGRQGVEGDGRHEAERGEAGDHPRYCASPWRAASADAADRAESEQPSCDGGDPAVVCTGARAGARDAGHPAEGVQELGRSAGVEWGVYATAIHRWEHVVGRPAPRPVDDAGRLSPRFVEWMQGYPEGWVDGLTRTQALKALGNAVVPQQGSAALRVLAPCGQQVAA